MGTFAATTPDEYIDALPFERREAVSEIREVIRSNLPPGYEEGIQHGMIAWFVPLERFPDTYNGEPLGLASLASQKNHISLYLNSVYGDPDTDRWFRDRWAETGKTLDMGKSCVRFRRLADVPLDVVAETIARTPIDAFIDRYQAVRSSSRALRSQDRT